MIDYILLIPIITSFIVSLVLLPYWIKKAKDIDLTWTDMNKYVSKKVPGSGGMIVILGFLVGIFAFVAYRTFVLESEVFLVEILATISIVLFLSGIGLVDDLFGWRKGGLRKKDTD